jgi:anhydro-N-acetylmuramic acid kinase
MHRHNQIIGLMSGTSLDGVDAVLVDFSKAHPAALSAAHRPYPQKLRDRLLQLHQPGLDDLHVAATLSQELVGIYADAAHAVLQHAGIERTQVAAIGCHGQTIRHQPDLGYTLQLNNPALLAEMTGLSVVADFRSRDIAAGGQGAPLVPAFHSALFRDAHKTRAILNIGGIANLTLLKPDTPTLGFDCGPGNMLLDAWIQRHQRQSFDDQGQWAAAGTVLPELLEHLLRHHYLAATPPKSCGREQFNLTWLDPVIPSAARPIDIQATLLSLTAISIQQAMKRWCGPVDELYVCGGGARNTALINQLSQLLPATTIQTTDSLGLPAEHVEATAFAWLAWRTLHGLPGNLPEVTGAAGPRILGAIYPA